MSAPSLSRHVFTTSRLAEFSSKKELVNQLTPSQFLWRWALKNEDS
jgi:hypothetical protein